MKSINNIIHKTTGIYKYVCSIQNFQIKNPVIAEKIKYPNETLIEKIDNIVDLWVLGDLWTRYVFHIVIIVPQSIHIKSIGIKA